MQPNEAKIAISGPIGHTGYIARAMIVVAWAGVRSLEKAFCDFGRKDVRTARQISLEIRPRP